jgi:predicted esterase
MQEHFMKVQRTARFHMLGQLETAREIWIVVHGYGQLARYFLNHFAANAKERCIVAPEGLSRFYLDTAHSRVGATWMTREDRMHEIEDHIAYLDQLVRELGRRSVPGTPVHALGFSQGVATVSRWAMQGSTPIKRLVLWAGSLPPELDLGTLRTWKDMQVDLVLGDQDPYANKESLEGSAQRMAAAGVRHRAHLFQGGHQLDALTLQRIMANG